MSNHQGYIKIIIYKGRIKGVLTPECIDDVTYREPLLIQAVKQSLKWEPKVNKVRRQISAAFRKAKTAIGEQNERRTI